MIRNAAEIDLDNRYVNQGYAIASGRFMTTDREGEIATTVFFEHNSSVMT